MVFSRVLAVLIAVLATAVAAETPAKQYFGSAKSPTSHRATPLGSYSKGCIAGAVQLPETGPTWQAMRLSRNRNYGHPQMIYFIEKLSQYATTQGWAGLYIGDISQPRGGPMLSGHASHQMGLDADIWMLPPKRLNLSRSERENLSSIAVTSGKGPYVNNNWTNAHYNIIREAAKNPQVARIFVNPAIKVKMCEMSRDRNRSWLGKVRPWYGHNYHFHVRLHCPPGASGCVEQAPVPQNDDCPTAYTWFQPPDPNAKPSKPKKKRELTLADLPASCRTVVSTQ